MKQDGATLSPCKRWKWLLLSALVIKVSLLVTSDCFDIYLSHQELNYSNNSYLKLIEVQNETDSALICHTNIPGCCRSNRTSISTEWHYPNGTIVRFRSGDGQNDSFNRDRGSGVVRLYRNTNAETFQSGIFSCKISIPNGKQQELLIGLYPFETGIPIINFLKYNSTKGLLTCISSGGPASEVTWNRIGNQHQEMINGTSATYHNFLVITSNNPSDFYGTFQCKVINAIGIHTRTETYRAIDLLIQDSVNGLKIITCYSNLTIQSIKLFNDSNGEVLKNSSDKQYLEIHLEDTRSLFNDTISCEVEIVLPGIGVVKKRLNTSLSQSENEDTNTSTGTILGAVFGVVVIIILAIIVVLVLLIVFRFIRKRKNWVFYNHFNFNSIFYWRKTEADSYTKGLSSFTYTNNGSYSDTLMKQETEKAESVPALVEAPVKEKSREGHFMSSIETRLKPVPLNAFRQHVQYLHTEKNKKFEFEFNSIEKSVQDNFTAALKNREKNRFKNIQPYDFNRVILSTLSGAADDSSDYINASYIRGYGRDRVYIAAQGPSENTEEDFWRMIFGNHIPIIIMLTRVFEGRKKCQQYWPETIDETYVPQPGSPFRIILNSTLPHIDFSVKELVVSKTGEMSHKLTLYQYTGWPDHGVPANAMSIISFIKMMRKRYPYTTSGPVLVHCSAGVGRTGSFITLDYMLERIKTEPTINVYEFVTNLRKQRMLMVQTLDQYIFIHTALNELLTCGETEIAAIDLRMTLQKLDKREKTDSLTGFEKQFNVLLDVTSNIPNMEFSDALTKDNKSLNRYKSSLPYNHTRVILRAATPQSSNYINASFVGGYRRSGAYIVTQGPLSHTVGDFWRMVTEQDVKCVVMLCRLKENGMDVCHRYWPQGKGSPEEFGQFVVTMTSQDIQSGYIMRKLEAVDALNASGKKSSSVIHIQYLQWPRNGIPTTTSGVLEIANLVQKVQMGTGNKPVVVMCNDSTNRSGAFITIHAQMEKLKAEGVVDVFQFIKSVRCHRHGLVTNKDQYKFCHEALADFLDGFDTYANFKPT